ncbi:hypothetical protein NDU88_007061 [Pleurodeles waltl]|uniref:Uncharacterized protein n=1 Tax=Pleurodeles waltl TaxID=8319 RepID=A0AAV7QJN1_PLEWA|nr:hypothetical protein NDU88_007061 [Pleurodeles waltl]
MPKGPASPSAGGKFEFSVMREALPQKAYKNAKRQGLVHGVSLRVRAVVLQFKGGSAGVRGQKQGDALRRLLKPPM